jgi:hypothetical protein
MTLILFRKTWSDRVAYVEWRLFQIKGDIASNVRGKDVRMGVGDDTELRVQKRVIREAGGVVWIDWRR